MFSLLKKLLNYDISWSKFASTNLWQTLLSRYSGQKAYCQGTIVLFLTILNPRQCVLSVQLQIREGYLSLYHKKFFFIYFEADIPSSLVWKASLFTYLLSALWTWSFAFLFKVLFSLHGLLRQYLKLIWSSTEFASLLFSGFSPPG